MTVRRPDKAGHSSRALCFDHTNYDRRNMSEPAQENMPRSTELAEPAEPDSRYKVAVYVPEADVDKVKQAGKIVHELQHHH